VLVLGGPELVRFFFSLANGPMYSPFSRRYETFPPAFFFLQTGFPSAGQPLKPGHRLLLRWLNLSICGDDPFLFLLLSPSGYPPFLRATCVFEDGLFFPFGWIPPPPPDKNGCLHGFCIFSGGRLVPFSATSLCGPCFFLDDSRRLVAFFFFLSCYDLFSPSSFQRRPEFRNSLDLLFLFFITPHSPKKRFPSSPHEGFSN